MVLYKKLNTLFEILQVVDNGNCLFIPLNY